MVGHRLCVFERAAVGDPAGQAGSHAPLPGSADPTNGDSGRPADGPRRCRRPAFQPPTRPTSCLRSSAIATASSRSPLVRSSRATGPNPRKIPSTQMPREKRRPTAKPFSPTIVFRTIYSRNVVMSGAAQMLMSACCPESKWSGTRVRDDPPRSNQPAKVVRERLNSNLALAFTLSMPMAQSGRPCLISLCLGQQGEYRFVREPRSYLVLWGPRLATHSRQADPRVRYRGKLQCCWRTESAAQSAMPFWRQPVYWHQPSRSSHRSSMNTPCCREVLRTMARCTFRSRAALKPNSSSRKRWRCCIPSTSRRPEELSRRSPRRSPIALWPGGGLRSASA